MAEEITTSAANQGGAIGHIVRIVGPVVDVEVWGFIRMAASWPTL